LGEGGDGSVAGQHRLAGQALLALGGLGWLVHEAARRLDHVEGPDVGIAVMTVHFPSFLVGGFLLIR
jgi:hypothetical protein